MTERGARAVLTGLGVGALVIGSAFVPGWPESELRHLVFWPVLLVASAFPAPCFDRGPGQAPFCEGTPVQLFGALLGFVAAFIVYASVGAAIAWALLPRISHGPKPAA